MTISKTMHMADGGKNRRATLSRQMLRVQICDLEQVTLKPQLQAYHCLTIWLQIWYHSLLCEDSIRKGADLEKQNCLFGVHPAGSGEKLSFFSTSKVHLLEFAKKINYPNIIISIF